MAAVVLGQYGAPQAVIDDARAKAKWIRQGSPANWQESAPDGFTRFTEIELLATRIHIHEDAYVTGSLQTPSYAEAVLATNPNLDNDQRQAAVSFRMQRADTLFGRQGGPPQMQVIIAEVALARFREADFYEEQIELLADRNQLEGVEVFIAPQGTPNPSTGCSYQLLSFDSDNDPDVVYHENLFGGQYEATKAKVDWCRKLFTATLPMALRLEEWRESNADK